MTDLDRFSRIAPYLLWKSMGLTGVSVLVLDRDNHCYLVRAGNGAGEALIGQTIAENSPLVEELVTHRGELYRQEIARQPAKKAVLGEMDRLRADLIIDSVSESEYFSGPTLLSALCLGRKLSGRPFSGADIDFLKTMANQASISIEYAFIFEELRRHQEQIIKSEKLAALGTATAGVAHELKNPLTFISTVAQVLKTRWDDPSFRETVLASLPNEVERMKLIVEGILDYSRSRELSLQPLEITDVIKRCLALLAYDLRKNNVALSENYTHNSKVMGDPNRLIQVFINLAANAIQALGEPGGSLTFSSRLNGGQVQLTIADTGPGIPAEKLGKIFDPFYTTKETGTGLGLAIAKKIIDEHHGQISVNSLLGKGTVFTISLPAAL